MARKTKLTKELIQEAESLVMMGNYTAAVCGHLGIHESTWYRWMAAGEKANSGVRRKIFDAIKRAEAAAEIRSVALIQKAAETDWKAVMAFLERKFPDRWARKSRIDAEMEHRGEVGMKIVVDYGE